MDRKRKWEEWEKWMWKTMTGNEVCQIRETGGGLIPFLSIYYYNYYVSEWKQWYEIQWMSFVLWITSDAKKNFTCSLHSTCSLFSCLYGKSFRWKWHPKHFIAHISSLFLFITTREETHALHSSLSNFLSLRRPLMSFSLLPSCLPFRPTLSRSTNHG